MSQKSIVCFLGAGFSYVAGVPLARDLFSFRPSVASRASKDRFLAVLNHYGEWKKVNTDLHAEQYLSCLFLGSAGVNAPKWKSAVEYIGAVIASSGAPRPSYNQNLRYSNRLNRPTKCETHQKFFKVIFSNTNNVSVITTNYDLLIERALRHKPMIRPRTLGCYYVGVSKDQEIKGASMPFSRWQYDKVIKMSGAIPVHKLHGSLNWHLSNDEIVVYQDMRPAFRHGGNAAIIPPIQEKCTPVWLKDIWSSAEVALAEASIWIVCGYSAPNYDCQVQNILKKAGSNRDLSILLMMPDSKCFVDHWKKIVPGSRIIPIGKLPSGILDLDHYLPELLA